MPRRSPFFFFNDTATTEIYTLSLHDALPISTRGAADRARPGAARPGVARSRRPQRLARRAARSLVWREPGDAQDRKSTTSELQSQSNLVCRLLLEKKKPPGRHR